MRETTIPVGSSSVSAAIFGEAPLGTVVVLGHGAGGDRRTPLLVRVAESLAGSGRGVVLFNFPYSERGGRRPDPPAVLEATVQEASDAARRIFDAQRVVTGGKSMGGRIASQVAARDGGADGLVFLGYPLHPPGKPEQLRDQHLYAIRAPMLFVQGTRDAFARWDLLAGVLERLGQRARLHRVEEGDHSFAVPKRAGTSAAEVEKAIVETLVAWLGGCGL